VWSSACLGQAIHPTLSIALKPFPQRRPANTAAQANQRRVPDLLEHLHPPQSCLDICTHLDQGKWKRCLLTTHFKNGEATDWIDRTVPVPTPNSLMLEQWMQEFVRLRKLNVEIMRASGQGQATGPSA